MLEGYVRVEGQANARGMLQGRFATQLGIIEGAACFIVDGKAWKMQDGIVYRSDDSAEADRLLRLARQRAVDLDREDERENAKR